VSLALGVMPSLRPKAHCFNEVGDILTWLENALYQERQDISKLLELKHEALISELKTKMDSILSGHQTSSSSNPAPIAEGETVSTVDEPRPAQPESSGLGITLDEPFLETTLKNIALEAVRIGNYWAPPEEQAPVLAYIAEVQAGLLKDQKWLKKNQRKLRLENELTSRYTVDEILAKQHEADGFDVFIQPDEACAAAASAETAAAEAGCISAGTALLAKRDARIFASASSWDKIGSLNAGQAVEAAGAIVRIENYIMVPVKPAGAVELKYLEIAGAGSRAGKSFDPGRLEQVRDGLATAVAAAESGGAPVALDELLELLEACVEAGELGAAVYCGEQLEALQRNCGSSVPMDVVERSFAALKRLLRPSAIAQVSKLEGPWSSSSMSKHRKTLGRLINMLVASRKEHRDEGEEAKHEDTKSAMRQEALAHFTRAVLCHLTLDAKALTAKRRGDFVEAVLRVCPEASRALAWAVVSELERCEVLQSRGREVLLCSDKASGECRKSSHDALAAQKRHMQDLEALAKERFERRKKRQKAREQGRRMKRRRTHDVDE